MLPGLTITLSGNDGGDAQAYQERELRKATERLRECGKEHVMAEHVDRDTNADSEWARVRRYAMVIEWSDEDQLFLVSIPDFPGAHTHGRSRAEAAEMGEEVIALLLDGEANPPAARYTAMDYPVRPEADIRELVTTERPG